MSRWTCSFATGYFLVVHSIVSQLKEPNFAALLAPAIVPFVAVAVIIGTGEHVRGLNSVMVFWTAVVSYASFFAFGYPLAKLLDKRDYLSICTLMAGGFVCGAVVGVLVGLGIGTVLGSYKALPIVMLIIFGGLGALVAFTFGLLAKVRWSRNPFQGN